MDPILRPFGPGDLDALYEICLKTGDSGADASALHEDPRLLGEIYAAPYATLEPGLALVAEDQEGVGAYIIGTADTAAFERRLESDWWPRLRAVHPDPSDIRGRDRTPDQWRAWQIHHPVATPATVAAAAPAHLHINLLPRLQGRGVGRRLVDAWRSRVRAQGAARVHLGCSPDNHRALRFYDLYGFERLEVPDAGPGVVWMAIDA